MSNTCVDAFIAVGSNIEPHRYIPEALARLQVLAGVKGTSTFYRTAPLGPPGQPDYRNGAFWIETNKEPTELHGDILRGIEAELGRERSAERYAPRTIDLDLVVYDDVVQQTESLRLPDPDLFERNFVALPLAELAPAFVVPGDGRTLAAIAERMSTDGMEADMRLTRRLKELLAHEQGTR